MKRLLKTVVLLLLLMFCFEAYAAVRVPELKKPVEILVEFKKELTAAEITSFKDKNGIEPQTALRAVAFIEKKYGLKRIKRHLDNVPFNCYKINDPSKINKIILELKTESCVLHAQPDFYRYALASYSPQSAPNDPIYQKTYTPPITPVDQYGLSSQPNQWGFNMIKADTAFNSGLISQFPARQVIVAVIDTGLKIDHEDFSGMTINGRNIITPAAEPLDDETDGGHGTHAAGIICAKAGNGMGLAGVAYAGSTWTARVLLMPVKVLNSEGIGSDSNAASGIIWAADNGADVINFSVGGPDQSDVLANAVNYAYQKGCVFVAAAGNSNSDVWYPAACSNAISVAATGESDVRVSFSNFGKIDVSAPGVDIWSATNWDDFSTTLPAYYSESGTSFAAPYVSGLAALIKLKFPGITPDEVRRIIERSARDIGASGYDIYTGWGRVDVVRALTQNFNTVQAVGTYNWPNPFSPGFDLFTAIVFYMDSPAAATVKIYDAGGDLVWIKDIASSQVIAGNNTIKWDGRNMAGKTCGNGTYFYTVKTGQITGKNKIVVLQ